jgi:hypothetical protein
MTPKREWTLFFFVFFGSLWFMNAAAAEPPVRVAVEGQPLAANVQRLLEALDYLGTPVPPATTAALRKAAAARDAFKLQELLDPRVLFVVSLDAKDHVKVQRGPGPAILQQAAFTPVLVKVINDGAATKQLRIASPQAGPPYAGTAKLSLTRQQQIELQNNENVKAGTDRFLDVDLFQSPPLTANLSGLRLEYVLALIYCSEAGKRAATVAFDLGQGADDRGLRGECPVRFEVRPAVPVQLAIRDQDGSPTVARLLFRDKQGRVYPPQARRLAPDFFFQPHIYRRDGDSVLLPPGTFALEACRGPEYLVSKQQVTVPEQGGARVAVRLQRWIDPAAHGFYSGDHHIHAAGCAHYNSPTEGVRPEDMFLQVKGEGMNVGCVLTWGPCFTFQRQFFTPAPHRVSEPWTVLKYDLEISGFGSQALGHVCLLNLRDQTYPGSDGTATRGWPTWTTPVMRWTKQQGGVAGYAHSASGLEINPTAAARRLLKALDTSGDGRLDREESARGLLPEPFAQVDTDGDGFLSLAELIASHDRVADRLPNLAVPEMNGVGAMEVCVSTAEGVCDFMSSMDTARIQEWNMWYHILNCGFPLKTSGETDFPCMSSRRVGQGRVYVHLGKVDHVDFASWCNGLAHGRSYVSDGYAHAPAFTVNSIAPGRDAVRLAQAGVVTIKAAVAFAGGTPRAVAHGGVVPPGGKRVVGDTVLLHVPRSEEVVSGGMRRVEVVVNGQAVAAREVPADGKLHELSFTVNIDRSSWVALRHFPQLHTNPVNVLVAEQPIRASRQSALWCVETIQQLWRGRASRIAPGERAEAERTFQRAIQRYQQIAREAPAGS